MTALQGCPGCGLFLGHVPGCNGIVAVFMRYGHEYEEDGFLTIEDAESFLRYGEDEGSLASVGVRMPDGSWARERSALGLRWP